MPNSILKRLKNDNLLNLEKEISYRSSKHIASSVSCNAIYLFIILGYESLDDAWLFYHFISLFQRSIIDQPESINQIYSLKNLNR